MEAASAIIQEHAARTRLVVVASAMGGVTDLLVKAAAAAADGDAPAALDIAAAIRSRHEVALARVTTGDVSGVLAELRRIVEELTELLRAVALLRGVPPRTRDRILSAGEKLSTRLLAAALNERGVTARAFDADTFLETDDRFGDAQPVPEIADRTVAAALRPALEKGDVAVVTGFCGRGPDGATTTLGRGGSDLTATFIAAAVRADEVTLWTDVDGVFSADPKVVPEARVIQHLNYREAAELAYYGAKVLYQRTLIPVVERGLTVRIRNSLAPDVEGTYVDGRFTPGSHPVKAISAVRGQTLISIEGKGMAGVPGVAARGFQALAERDISVTMISQSSAESSICLALPKEEAPRAERALKQAFRPELTRGDVEEIVVLQNVAIVAAVGLGMAQTPGIAGRVFQALGKRHVNVLAIAQGSSELNISLAIDARDVERAVGALHEAFGLHRRDTGEDTTRNLDLLLLGCGKIGRALVRLVEQRDAHVFERFGLRVRIVAIADRSGFLFRPTGLTRDDTAQVLAAKTEGRSLAELGGDVQSGSPETMVATALSYRLARPVLVDVSDADDASDAFRAAFQLGCDVVTANKKPLAGPLATFRSLRKDAVRAGRVLKAEATVGAGLPVVDSLEMLLATGDRILSVEGVFSGTLAFLMTRLEEDAPFSVAVAEAVRQGYTEPDPVADLSGADVARKAIIVGRLSGLIRADEPVALTGLVESGLAGLELPDLLRKLEDYDEPMAARIAAAAEKGNVLRYLARIEPDAMEVGLTEVGADSPLYGLKGTDNMIVFTTERYSERPLVVTGPGAGVDVTAMGVLGDILRIAAERG